jgi:hypothetical protein
MAQRQCQRPTVALSKRPNLAWHANTGTSVGQTSACGALPTCAQSEPTERDRRCRRDEKREWVEAGTGEASAARSVVLTFDAVTGCQPIHEPTQKWHRGHDVAAARH